MGYTTKSQVSAAFALAVKSAKGAGIDTQGWVLFEQSSAYAVMRRDDEGLHSGVIPGYYHLGATKREALEALRIMRAAWDLVPRALQPGVRLNPCFHCDASNGLTYGVAAKNHDEAKILLLQRLLDDNDTSIVLGVTRMGNWMVEHGTVLCYGETL